MTDGQESDLERYMNSLRDSDVPDALPAFAARAGTSVEYLWHVARGHRSPGARTMYGIVNGSDGTVSYRSLVESSPALSDPSRVGISTRLDAKRKRQASHRNNQS